MSLKLYLSLTISIQPVYTDELDDAPASLHRSASCPDLQLYRDPGTPPSAPRRRRALSVPYCEDPSIADGRRTTSMVRIQSDTDLSRIDRARTFGDIGGSQPFGHEHILAQVVSALGSIRPADDDDGQSVLGLAMDYGPSSMLSADGGGGGVHGFSDADILASELINSGWTLNQSADSGASYANTPKHRRARAASVFCVPTLSGGAMPANSSHEWTWSGQQAAQVQEFLRGKTKPRKQSLFRNLFVNSGGTGGGSSGGVAMTSASSSTDKLGRSRTHSVSITMPSGSLPDMPATTAAAAAAATSAASGAPHPSLFAKMNPFRRRILGEHGHRHSITGLDELTPQQYLERSARGRESRVSQPFGPRQYLQATARGRKSAFSVMTTAEPAHDDVLENTTIADLIRALEVVHTKVQNESAASPLLSDSPRRKMGVASLTPPKMSPTAGVRNVQARRGSLRPTPTYTTVFNSKLQQPRRRQSQHFSGGMPDLSASFGAAAAAEQPPPYDASPKPSPNRRFSVRPTNLSMAPGQVFQIPSVQAQSAVQRRLSLKPSPLLRGVGGTSSGRYVRGSAAPSQQGASLSPRMPRQQLQQLQEGVPTPATGGRNVVWRPTLVRTGRTRHGSLSELNEEERNERKRSDSK